MDEMKKLPFEHTLAAMEKIWNLDGEAKHGDAWKTRPDNIDLDAADRHRIKDRGEDFNDYDADSGELHAEHELIRLMCRNERRRIRMTKEVE
jgi:hypothetical protein